MLYKQYDTCVVVLPHIPVVIDLSTALQLLLCYLVYHAVQNTIVLDVEVIAIAMVAFIAITKNSMHFVSFIDMIHVALCC